MKKIIVLLLFFGIWLPALPFDGSSCMSLDEYSLFFEIGLDEGDEEDTICLPEIKEKIDLSGGEIIELEAAPVKLRVEKGAVSNSYREVLEVPQTGIELIKTEKFSFFSDAKKELSDYMTNNIKSTMNMSYDFNNKVTLQAGHEVWYVNPNAYAGAKKIYFNPRLNFTERCYLDYSGKFNQKTKNLEQELGVNYMPVIFNNSASFGVKASAVVNDNNEIQSRKLKFVTDFYLF